jgi:hypothetical protein
MVVIACLIVLACLALFQPRLALAYVFFSFSFEQLLRTKPPDVVSDAGALLPPIRFSQFVTLILFALLLLRWAREMRIPRPGLVLWLFAGYVGANIISFTYSAAPGATVRQIVIVALIFITMITFAYWVHDLAQAEGLIRALYWGAALHFVWALAQLLAYVLFKIEIGYYAPGMGEFLKVRAFGWMFEPNWLGVFIVAVFPWFLLAFDYRARLRMRRSVAIVGMGLLGVTLLLNMSRFAWIAVGLQLLLWALAFSEHRVRYLRRAWIWSLPALALGLSVWFFGPSGLRESIIQRFVDLTYLAERRGSANVRLANYIQLLELARESPWFGSGSGTWGALTGTIAQATTPTTTYLYVLVEVGAVGLLLLLLAITVYLARLYRASFRAPQPLRIYLVAALLSVVGVLVSGWFVDIKSIAAYFPIFGSYLGLARLASRAHVSEAAAQPAAIRGQAAAHI